LRRDKATATRTAARAELCKKKEKIIKKTGVFRSPQTAVGEAVNRVQRTGKHRHCEVRGEGEETKNGKGRSSSLPVKTQEVTA